MLRYASIGLAVWIAMDFAGYFTPARTQVAALHLAAGRAGRIWVAEMTLVAIVAACWPAFALIFMLQYWLGKR